MKELLRDSDFLLTLVVVSLIVFGTVVTISLVALDRSQERFMAEKHLCYQAVDRTNAVPVFQYQPCGGKQQ